MAFLTIAGTTVDVMAERGSAEQEPIMIGRRRRAWDGTLLSTERGRKRVWRFTTAPILQATFETLETATANGAFVDCTGTALSDDTISCRVTITEAGYLPISASHLRVLTLTLEEV